MTLQSSFCLAIAQVYNNEGTEAFLREDYSNAFYFFTEGIKVNCKDEDGMAMLYSNRAHANLHLGELTCCCCCFFFFANSGQAVFAIQQIYWVCLSLWPISTPWQRI